MTVSELRTLVDNLDEYIHIPGGIDRLKKMVLHLAVSGQLVPQDPSEGTGEELYRQIQAEKAELVKQGKLKKQKPLSKIESDDLLPGIPLNWTQVKIGDASIYQQRGKSPKYTTTSSYPVVSQKCVRWNHIDWQHVKFITPESIEKYEEFRMLRDGDLLLNSTGTGTMGRVGIYRENKQYDRVVVDSHVTVVRFSDFISAGFAHIFFRSPYVQEDVESKASGSTNQIEWNLSSIQNEIMPLPPLGEQKRIVAKVDSIFALIDQLAEVYKSEQTERSKLVASSLAQLAKGEDGVKGSLALNHLSEIIRTKADAKIIRQTILHLAVSGQLVPQDPSEGSGEELYRHIQAEKAALIASGKLRKQKPLPEVSNNNTPFAIPKSWRWVQLGEVAEYKKGPFGSALTKSMFIPKSPGAIKVYEQKNAIQKDESLGHYYITRDYYDSKMSGFSVKPDDIIVSCAGTIGEMYVIPDGSEEGIINQALMRVRLSKLTDMQFYLICLDMALSANMDKAMGSAIKNIPPFAVLKNITIPLPPLAEQKRIVTKTTQLLNLITELEEHLVG